jgi:hypothetical protein
MRLEDILGATIELFGDLFEGLNLTLTLQNLGLTRTLELFG